MAIRGLAQGLRSLGHRVDRPGPRVGRAGSTAARLLYNGLLPFRLDAGAYDIVVGFDLDGCFLPRRDGGVRVASLKGVMADELRFERGWTRIRFRLLSRLERAAARRADRVVVPSEYSRGVVAGLYGVERSRIDVVPEGLDVERWERLASDTPPPGADSGMPTILNVARQYPRKNTADLLRALPRVRERVSDARLRVVGGGPELERLERLAGSLELGEAVEFTGPIRGRAKLRREYDRADVFCLPTLQEGFGIVFLEAMAAGVPVVASDVTAVPEVVPDRRAGLLVPPRDPAALSSALVRLLEDPELRRRLGREGRRHARRYAWPRVARIFLSSVLDDGRPRAGRW